ncbi:MAG: hypothetical protein JOS17DRAFT_773252 [Linnemannia elongata]|nr:MAG: hypothetical protein JOS17DRAFT_773252 [Linnemannia elongata]
MSGALKQFLCLSSLVVAVGKRRQKCSAENNELALAEGRKMTMDAQKVGRGQLDFRDDQRGSSELVPCYISALDDYRLRAFALEKSALALIKINGSFGANMRHRSEVFS